MPLVVRAKDNGALLQRFLFAATVADVHLKVDTRGALVATPRSFWGLGRRKAGSSPGGVTLP